MFNRYIAKCYGFKVPQPCFSMRTSFVTAPSEVSDYIPLLFILQAGTAPISDADRLLSFTNSYMLGAGMIKGD